MFCEKNRVAYIETEENQVHEYQKWKHITLSDFRSQSYWSIFSYGWLWFLALIAVLVYAADTYTAVILLAYNRWPGQIAPSIPFSVSRWIFAVCIIFSWVLLGYQWLRAVRVMRRGSVAKDYLDPLAAQFQSMRSWRRFLVFAQLTQSKKGADYVALFSYFQFQGSIRILVAQGPRQVINALTLYAVMQAVLIPTDNKGASQFWTNVKALAQQQSEHAIILFTMLFTLIIWAFSMLCLIGAGLSYCCFLWHYVGRNLTRYCKRKIEKRLKKIVAAAIEKELQRQERMRERAPFKRPRLFSRSNTSTSFSTLQSHPTLPTIPDLKDSDAVSISTTVTRNASNASTSTLASSISPYPFPPSAPQPARLGNSSTQKLARQPTLPCIEESDSATGTPTRQNSNGSTSSHGSNADDRPLLQRGVTDSAGARTQSSETLPRAMMVPPLRVGRKPVPGARTRFDGPNVSGARGGGGGGPRTFEAMGV